ncbi:MAG: hypothetical protein HY741_15005 [Chloroflexi bacterium]|nr:hypothetical protein [Chloroflexota bacterium]
MNPPRFLLVLAIQANLVRAALVTRDLRIVSSAHQTFRLADGSFDPAEVWYKLKRVTAACFDIGRTLPREIITGALLSDDDAWVVWQANAGEVQAVGILRDDARSPATAFDVGIGLVRGGTMRTWLLWNLSGAYCVPARELEEWHTRAAQCSIGLTPPRVCPDAAQSEGTALAHSPVTRHLSPVTPLECFGKIRARGPFAAELPIANVFAERDLVEPGQNEISPDQAILRAAARVSSTIKVR